VTHGSGNHFGFSCISRRIGSSDKWIYSQQRIDTLATLLQSDLLHADRCPHDLFWHCRQEPADCARHNRFPIELNALCHFIRRYLSSQASAWNVHFSLYLKTAVARRNVWDFPKVKNTLPNNIPTTCALCGSLAAALRTPVPPPTSQRTVLFSSQSLDYALVRWRWYPVWNRLLISGWQGCLQRVPGPVLNL